MPVRKKVVFPQWDARKYVQCYFLLTSGQISDVKLHWCCSKERSEANIRIWFNENHGESISIEARKTMHLSC